ncbi:NYN domain-containing protein, partial [bacterium]|nr:NYN domain-containing protein [bacterium]
YIASDMLSLAFRDAYDIAILISGDTDYVRVIDEIQELGKIVEVASFKYGKSWDLEKACDKYILLDPIVLKMCSTQTT